MPRRVLRSNLYPHPDKVGGGFKQSLLKMAWKLHNLFKKKKENEKGQATWYKDKNNSKAEEIWWCFSHVTKYIPPQGQQNVSDVAPECPALTSLRILWASVSQVQNKTIAHSK